MLCPPGGEWALGENRYRSLCGWVPSLFIWNYHNIVNQLYFSTKYKVEKKKRKKTLPQTIPTYLCVVLRQSQLSLPMEAGAESQPSLSKPQPTQQAGVPWGPRRCRVFPADTPYGASRPMHPVSASPEHRPSTALRSWVSCPALPAPPWLSGEPSRKEDSVQVRHRLHPTPVPPQSRVPVALEPQGPISLLTCFFPSSHYHTQLFPRRTVSTARSLGEARSPEHLLPTPRTAQAPALWLLYSAGSWHFNCSLLSLTSCPCNLQWFSSGFPGGSDRKESACNAGDPGSIPGSGRFPGEGNGSPLQYSCLKNSMERGAWQTTVHGVAELDMTERLTHT